MHPEVQNRGPGSCPDCGMALEPLRPTAAEDTSELDAMRRRFWVSLALTLPVFALAMGEMVLGPDVLPPLPWVQALLTTPVVLWCAAPFFARGARSLRTGLLNMFTLISLGIGAAYAASVLAVVLPGAFPASFRTAGGEAPVYFEAAAVITTLVLLGQVLELRARRRTGAALRLLLAGAPARALRITDAGEEDVCLHHVAIGDRLRIRPGDSVPVDGCVVDGRSAVDESTVSGEPMPVAKEPGDRVLAGTLNGRGSLVIEAQQVGDETLLARIIALVAEAQRSQAPIQRLADRVAAVFVPAVLGVAGVTFAVWAGFGPEPRLTHALVAAIAVLIIACPCALGLATPMSITVAAGRGARQGLLFRDAAAIERLCAVDTLVVDKTGTLTEGRPRLTDVLPAPGFTRDEVLALAASVERHSEHPLANALLETAREAGSALRPVEEFTAQPGRGVTARVDGRQVELGNAPVGATDRSRTAEALRAEGKTVVFLRVDGRAAGTLAVADPVKETTPAAVASLRRAGLRIVMLTGDAETTAAAVARELGIDEVVAGVLPDAKAEMIRRLRTAGHRVAMVGDGVNDAPALAEADVGIAMGTGADVALEASDLTLASGDLTGLERARRLSAATVRNVRQNLFFAFVYNTLGVPVAAGALYPLLGWMLNPMWGAAAMSLSSVSVIANALRLQSGSEAEPAPPSGVYPSTL
ncbi:MAG: cadmium-translocating P-type ATPase [Proteobacteria bacterium]|nr:cadmium-translocating P-type ATPase [Pseudomonadota bacterium]